MMQAGQRLGAILDSQGRKQNWLATQLGVSESYISHIIAGRKPFPQRLVKQSAFILGIPPNMLYDNGTGESATGEER